jgi:hypothetical protein
MRDANEVEDDEIEVPETTEERSASALENISSWLGWIAFWLFILCLNTCNGGGSFHH